MGSLSIISYKSMWINNCLKKRFLCHTLFCNKHLILRITYPNLQESPNIRKWMCTYRPPPTSHFLWNHSSTGTSSVHLTTFSTFAGVLPFPLCLFPQSHPYFPESLHPRTNQEPWICFRGQQMPGLGMLKSWQKNARLLQALVRTIVPNLEMSRACHATFSFLHEKEGSLISIQKCQKHIWWQRAIIQKWR